MPLQRSAQILILGIVITVPLIFGAVHPIVQSVYVVFMLVGCGGWLIFTMQPREMVFPSFWLLIPLLLIAYIIVQSVPLPLLLIEQVSSARADRISMVNELAGTAVGWTTISDNGAVGIYRGFFLIGLLLYFFALTRLCANDPKFFRTLIYCLVIIGAAEAAYGILQFLRPQLGILWLKLTAGRAAYGTIIYKNQYASMLNMIWPLALTGGVIHLIGRGQRFESGAVFTTTRGQAPLLIFAAGLMILAVLFSLSRGGILTMACVALLLTLLLPFSIRGKLKFLLFFGLAIFGYVMLLGLDTIINRFDSISTSGGTRLDVYRYSIPMLMDHWLTGIGLGSYQFLSPIYLKGFPEKIQFYRAHNEYLELFIELGLVIGGLLFAWIGAGLLGLFLRLRNVTKRYPQKIAMIAVAAASLCGLIGFFLHGVVDFGWRLPVNLVFAVTLLAILATSLASISAEEPRRDHDYAQ